ncbi:MAG: fibronectin type III domain-containing protein, partial [Nitrospirales bacterium]
NGLATINVLTGALKAGTYTGGVTLNANGASSVTVPVTFTVTPGATTASPIILSPPSLSYVATQGAANPVNQSIALTNIGGTLNWTVSDDASWLTVSPPSGSGNSTLTTSVNTAGVTVGTHTGTLTVSAAGTASKTIAVTLIVNAPATSSATLTWNANTESDLAGYKVYIKDTASGAYGSPVTELQGNVTTFIATGLKIGTTYYFAITAYDLSGNESPISHEVSKSMF